MDKLLVILRNPPYGTTNAAEAVRHAGGASGFEYKPILYLIDGGVCSAKKNQNAGDTGFSSVGESIELMSDEMEIYAYQDSVKEFGLNADDLIAEVKIDDGTVLKESLKSARSIMIF
jgi:sulfur relay (sulfurtransferase) DsrF/TusC family protein